MRASLVASGSLWVANFCLYGSLFYIVLANVGTQLHKIRQQLTSVKRFDAPAYVVEPFQAKQWMYRMFLGLVLVFMIAQVTKIVYMCFSLLQLWMPY